MAVYGWLIGIVVSTLTALAATVALIRSLREWKSVRLQTAKLEAEIAKLREEARERAAQIVKPSTEDLERYVLQQVRQEIREGFQGTVNRLASENRAGVVEPIMKLIQRNSHEFQQALSQAPRVSEQMIEEMTKTITRALQQKESSAQKELLQRLAEIETKITELKPWWKR
jgi:hypothetical protein